jgi:hypothetical protein
VRRCPQQRKALVVGWPRWFLAAVLLGLVMGHARGDNGSAWSSSSWLAAQRHGSRQGGAANAR